MTLISLLSYNGLTKNTQIVPSKSMVILKMQATRHGSTCTKTFAGAGNERSVMHSRGCKRIGLAHGILREYDRCRVLAGLRSKEKYW